MILDMKFSELSQKIDTQFQEQDEHFSMKAGELTTVHDGQNGATFYPSVSAEGVISWTNDRGLDNPQAVNIKGERGPQGVQGERGADGAKGDKGDRGEQGIQGAKGDKGDKGDQGIQGEKGEAGADGKNGVDGKDGQNGVDGKTPIKGTDYFTEADKAEMVSAVISALPIYNGEVVAE